MTDRQRQIAYNQSIKAPVANIAGELQRQHGQRMIAFVTGHKSPKVVGRWALGRNRPGEDAETRLRLLYRVVLTLETREAPDTVRAWLVGSNPGLDDRAPVELIREGSLSALYAAENFIDA